MATVGTGKYTYELIENWAKLPPGETFGNTSAVATDSQDRVYVFQRKDPPMMVFDRDGTYLQLLGHRRLRQSAWHLYCRRHRVSDRPRGFRVSHLHPGRQTAPGVGPAGRTLGHRV